MLGVEGKSPRLLLTTYTSSQASCFSVQGNFYNLEKISHQAAEVTRVYMLQGKHLFFQGPAETETASPKCGPP